jgi:hypothetical protein
MQMPLFSVVLLFGLMAGCAGQSRTVPVEVLDERTGVTLGALKEPIELVPSAQHAALTPGKRTSFAYLGPIEWDRMGTIAYGLWVHIAPGNDRPAADIRSPSVIELVLDDGPVNLSPIEAPKLGHEPYRQVVSWGQTAYFDLTPEALIRMAASRKLELTVGAADGSTMSFYPSRDTRAALSEYIRARGITGD